MSITNNQKMDNGYYIKFDKGFSESLYATQGEIGKKYYFTIIGEADIPQEAKLEMTIEMKEGVAKFEGLREDSLKPNTFEITVPQKALSFYGSGKYQIHLRLPDDEKYIATRKGEIYIARNMLFDNGDINFFFDFEDILTALKEAEASIEKVKELQVISNNHLNKIDKVLTELYDIERYEKNRQENELKRNSSEDDRNKAEKQRADTFKKMVEELEKLGLGEKYDKCFNNAEINGNKLKFTRANGEMADLTLPSGVTSWNDLTDKPNLEQYGHAFYTGVTTEKGIGFYSILGGYTEIETPKPSLSYNDLTDKPDLSNLNNVPSSYTSASYSSSGLLKLTKHNGYSTNLDIGEKIPIYSTNYRNYKLRRVGNQVTCTISSGTSISNGKLSDFLPSDYKPKTTTHVSMAYHNNARTIMILCFKIWTDGEIYCRFTTIGNDGTIITDRDSGTIQEDITITFGI